MANVKKDASKDTTMGAKESKNTKELESLKDELKTTQESLMEAFSIIKDMKELINNMNQTSNTNSNNSSNTTSGSKREYVTIIHLDELADGLSTHIELSNLTIDLHSFGEERTLTWQQFEELAGKYKLWFDKDIISLSDNDSDLVDRYRLKSIKEVAFNMGYLKRLERMSTEELEEIYNKISKNHKDFIIRYWTRKYYEGDNNFSDRRKIDLLNTLSNGLLDNVIKDMNEKQRRT